jgi:hypothetical protein
MGCHTYVKTDSEKLKLLEKVGKLESLLSGLRCICYLSTHISIIVFMLIQELHVFLVMEIAEMEVVYQVKPLSMDWCLDCHRSDAPEVRPVNEVTNMYWTPPADYDQFVSSWVAAAWRRKTCWRLSKMSQIKKIKNLLTLIKSDEYC